MEQEIENKKLTKQEFINMNLKNIPVSKDEVNLARLEGRMKSVEIEGLEYNSKRRVEFFEWGEDSYAVVLAGGPTNPFQGYAFLIDKQLWSAGSVSSKRHVPHYSWRVDVVAKDKSRSGYYVYINTTVSRIKIRLSKSILKCIGVDDQYLVYFSSQFDCRLKFITTSDYNLKLKGTVGLGKLPNSSSVRILNSFAGKRSDLYRTCMATAKNKIEAQQMYNAALLKYKSENTSDINCFGWVFKNGVLQRLFPDYCYNSKGFLLSNYLEIFKRNPWLFIPISDKTILSEILNAGKNWLGKDAVWLTTYSAMQDGMCLRLMFSDSQRKEMIKISNDDALKQKREKEKALLMHSLHKDTVKGKLKELFWTFMLKSEIEEGDKTSIFLQARASLESDDLEDMKNTLKEMGSLLKKATVG